MPIHLQLGLQACMNAHILAMIFSHKSHYNPSHFSDLIALFFLFNNFTTLHSCKIWIENESQKFPPPGFESGSAAYEADGLPMYHLARFVIWKCESWNLNENEGSSENISFFVPV